jgi:hypothetical protein
MQLNAGAICHLSFWSTRLGWIVSYGGKGIGYLKLALAAFPMLWHF